MTYALALISIGVCGGCGSNVCGGGVVVLGVLAVVVALAEAAAAGAGGLAVVGDEQIARLCVACSGEGGTLRDKRGGTRGGKQRAWS